MATTIRVLINKKKKNKGKEKKGKTKQNIKCVAKQEKTLQEKQNDAVKNKSDQEKGTQYIEGEFLNDLIELVSARISESIIFDIVCLVK